MRIQVPWDFLIKTLFSAILIMGPQLLCKRKTCISALSPKDSNFSILKHWKQTSEISSNFPHESKMKPRVASFLYRRAGSIVSLLLSHNHLLQLCLPQTSLFFLPDSLTQNSCRQGNLVHQGKGVSAPLRVCLSGSDQEGVLPVSISPDGSQIPVPPCHVLPLHCPSARGFSRALGCGEHILLSLWVLTIPSSLWL